MYSYLIPDDKIKNLDPIQVLELVDFINMRNQLLPTGIKWLSIKSMVVTEGGMTLWQLSEKYLDSQGFRPIGQLESPVDLFKWVLENSSIFSSKNLAVK